MTTGFYTYTKFLSPEGIANEKPNDGELNPEDEEENDNLTPLDKAMRDSNRINVLLIGLEGPRSDTIMLASFDRKTKEANILSIPRDTYYQRPAYDKYSEMQKINAVYGSEEGRAKALMEVVENITGIPVEKYVSINYDGVRKAVTAIGGVKVNVPIRMKYTDIYDDPPLYIDIQPGEQMIYGDKALELLRFRNGDPGYPSFPDGDVGRVKMQQEFVRAAIKKSLSLKLPIVISEIYKHVETNFTMTELAGLAKDAIGFSTENLTTSILPGTAKYLGKLSFFIPDGEKITEFVYELYDVPLSAATEGDNVADATE